MSNPAQIDTPSDKSVAGIVQTLERCFNKKGH